MVSGTTSLFASFPEDFFIHWKDDVINVRNLYRERKYRRCAVLCSELLEEAIHPVHKTFLHFYQAICYESLGHIAHNYSSNKIPLFEQARDAFVSASEALPLPSHSTINNESKTTDPSPICATLDIAALYDIPTPSSVYPSPCPQISCDQRSLGSATPTPSNQIPRTYSAPKFEDYSYSPRISFKPTTPIRHSPSPDFHTPNEHRAIRNHKNRLSRTLSSQHALAEELVPSPLFSRGPSSKKESRSQCQSHTSTQSLPILTPPLPLPQVSLSRPLPPTPSSRPLPNLPFNHNPQFIRKGKRFVVVPRRKTALSTLISRWEGKVPFNDFSTPYSAGAGRGVVEDGSKSVEATPVTERFRRISAIFVEKEIDEKLKSCGRTAQQKLKDRVIDNAAEDSVSGSDGYEDSVSDTSDDIDSDSNKKNINGSPSYGHSPKSIAPSSPTRSLIPRPQKATSYPLTPRTPCPTHRPLLSPMKSEANTSLGPYTPTTTPNLTNTKLNPQPTPDLPPPPPSPPVHLLPTTTSTNTTDNPLSSLQALQAQLHIHIQSHTTTLTTTILQTRLIQETHDQEKRSRFLNTHRRRAPSPSPSPSPTKRGNSSTKTTTTKRDNRASRITPSQDFRLRSFWSLQAAEATCSAARKRHVGSVNGTGVDEHRDDEATRRKWERIDRLKSQGWVVRKEKHGFKGVGYYEGIRGIVKRELEGRL